MRTTYHKQLDVSYLKEMIAPIDFYIAEGQEVKIKGGSPWKLGGLCPFHDDHHVGSFYIHDISGGYSCFSCGATGGDIIDFTQMKYGLSFGEAIRKLARQWRVS
jgi:DNA primase